MTLLSDDSGENVEGGFVISEMVPSRKRTRSGTRKKPANVPAGSRRTRSKSKQKEITASDHDEEESEYLGGSDEDEDFQIDDADEDDDEDYVDGDIVITGHRKRGEKSNPVELSDDDIVVISGTPAKGNSKGVRGRKNGRSVPKKEVLELQDEVSELLEDQNGNGAVETDQEQREQSQEGEEGEEGEEGGFVKQEKKTKKKLLQNVLERRKSQNQS